MALTIRRQRGSTRFDAVLVATTKKAEACRSLDTFCRTRWSWSFRRFCSSPTTGRRSLFLILPLDLSLLLLFLSFFSFSMKFRFLRIEMTRNSFSIIPGFTSLRLRSLIFFLYRILYIPNRKIVQFYEL